MGGQANQAAAQRLSDVVGGQIFDELPIDVYFLGNHIFEQLL